jgi:hypothetical protein
VIEIPCDIKKPDTYVAGFGPVLSFLTENNKIMNNSKKFNK